MLTHQDIRDVLAGFAAAIELDQIRVDCLPPTKFHALYDDSMWRNWRRAHLELIDQLLPTVTSMPMSLLHELAQLAMTREPRLVRAAALNLLSETAVDSPDGKFSNASLFFGALVKEVRGKQAGLTPKRDAKSRVKQWFAVTDPLRIAEDPECGYQPSGLIS